MEEQRGGWEGGEGFTREERKSPIAGEKLGCEIGGRARTEAPYPRPLEKRPLCCCLVPDRGLLAVSLPPHSTAAPSAVR